MLIGASLSMSFMRKPSRELRPDRKPSLEISKELCRRRNASRFKMDSRNQPKNKTKGHFFMVA
jgi:hypothetical protein